MNEYYVDLHIHIGRTEKGSPVKISGSKDLTFYNIAREASERKGIQVTGIIDCHSPQVQEEIEHYLHNGEMEELEGGGIRYKGTTVLLGSEIEVRDPGLRPAHLLVYLPTLQVIKDFTNWLGRHMKNVSLSSQRIYVPARTLQEEAAARGGFLIPAHIFTPHKSLYGSSVDRMADLLDPSKVAAVELGLSSDTSMADGISELAPYTFVTNSDAHSLAKIGREYNKMRLAEPSFAEVRKALLREDGRCVTANYGLSPRLGKYHQTFCTGCGTLRSGGDAGSEGGSAGDYGGSEAAPCPNCGKTGVISGVASRIAELSDKPPGQSPDHRPPYYIQVPLEFLPGLGPKLLQRLLDHFGTEMNILHQVPLGDLEEVAGPDLARLIGEAREGTLKLSAGGGGRYGKVIK
ncbi:PHP-associated domain-containing protein [Paenibacillus turpanensis]|uniref:PHP-associated domain-containing protein n=1 Tax=Paenibacillus turpanensis TaxID=2689078 RepID=UPI00140A731A